MVRTRRRIAAGISVVIAVTLSACRGYQPATRDVVPSLQAVRVKFASPRTLHIVSPQGDTVVLHGVRSVSGTPVITRGDTLELKLDAVDPGSHSTVAGARVRIEYAPDDRVRHRDIDAGRTIALAGGLLAVASVVVLVMLAAPFGGGDF